MLTPYKSLTYIRKNKSSNVEPCDTPIETDLFIDLERYIPHVDICLKD